MPAGNSKFAEAETLASNSYLNLCGHVVRTVIQHTDQVHTNMDAPGFCRQGVLDLAQALLSVGVLLRKYEGVDKTNDAYSYTIITSSSNSSDLVASSQQRQSDQSAEVKQREAWPVA